jgi:uncharacterized protein
MINVVIDTQLLLRATVNPFGLSGKILFEYGYQYNLVYSDETLSELKDVLSRPKLRKKFTTLTDEISEKVLSHIQTGTKVVLPKPVPKIVRDAKDDIFLACAIVANAQYLISQDKDLLVLNPYESLQIVDIPTFWDVLKKIKDNE